MAVALELPRSHPVFTPEADQEFSRAELLVLFCAPFIIFVGMATAILLVPLDTPAGRAVKHITEAFNEQKPLNDTRDLMYLCGLLCWFVYLPFQFYFIYSYVTAIWNYFFVRKGDHRIFYAICLAQSTSSVLFVLIPQFWYINVLLLQLFIFVVTGSRYLALDQKYRSHISKMQELNDHRYLDDTQLYLLYSGVRATSVKWLAFALPFFAVMILSHVSRSALDHFFGRSANWMEFVLVGSYLASSLIFVYSATLNTAMRSQHYFDQLRERTLEGDKEYFRAMVR